MSALTVEQKIDRIYGWMAQLMDGGKQGLKETVNDPWIDEEAAAKLLNTKPRTLREKAKKNIWKIHFRTNPGGREFEYKKKDILKFKMQTSTEV